MNDNVTLELQKWWMAEIQKLTKKVIHDEEKREEKIQAANMKILGDLEIERREDIDDLYGYGMITEKKRDKLIELFEEMQPAGNELYERKLKLLDELFHDARKVYLEAEERVKGL